MYRFLSLVLAFLFALTVRSLVLAEDQCPENSTARQNICIYVTNCKESNTRLRLQVRRRHGVVDEAQFGLRNPTNVTTFPDFYLELVKYRDILQGLDSSLKLYQTTSDYSRRNFLLSVTNYINNYTQKINESLTTLRYAIGYISQSVGLTTPVVVTSTPGTSAAMDKTDNDIYKETYYVTNNLARLIQNWLQECECI